MNLLFDTNILLAIVRSKDYDGIINFLNPDNRLIYVSVVSEAEIEPHETWVRMISGSPLLPLYWV
ncbi:hypothetical protein GCM10023231_01150 [Olivibacter ginsenosidimutans]|uniref:PIN domain-containing protein n=1 Tax=Olivibacter ginsenosidimutans TaxID=1176537 RepID=A0ABP9ADS2_9SPHI